MSIGNIPKATWVDDRETLNPTQVFSGFCCQGSRVTKGKENWASKQEAIPAANICPFFFLQSLYLNRGGGFLPAQHFNEQYPSFCAYKLNMLPKTRLHFDKGILMLTDSD